MTVMRFIGPRVRSLRSVKGIQQICLKHVFHTICPRNMWCGAAHRRWQKLPMNDDKWSYIYYVSMLQWVVLVVDSHTRVSHTHTHVCVCVCVSFGSKLILTKCFLKCVFNFVKISFSLLDFHLCVMDRESAGAGSWMSPKVNPQPPQPINKIGNREKSVQIQM